jgi:hypothetical protein
MSEKEPTGDATSKVEPRTSCCFCGRDESGEWRWSGSLGKVVCDDYYRRGMSTPPPTTPAVKPS